MLRIVLLAFIFLSMADIALFDARYSASASNLVRIVWLHFTGY